MNHKEHRERKARFIVKHRGFAILFEQPPKAGVVFQSTLVSYYSPSVATLKFADEDATRFRTWTAAYRRAMRHGWKRKEVTVHEVKP